MKKKPKKRAARRAESFLMGVVTVNLADGHAVQWFRGQTSPYFRAVGPEGSIAFRMTRAERLRLAELFSAEGNYNPANVPSGDEPLPGVNPAPMGCNASPGANATFFANGQGYAAVASAQGGASTGNLATQYSAQAAAGLGLSPTPGSMCRGRGGESHVFDAKNPARTSGHARLNLAYALELAKADVRPFSVDGADAFDSSDPDGMVSAPHVRAEPTLGEMDEIIRTGEADHAALARVAECMAWNRDELVAAADAIARLLAVFKDDK